MIANFIKTFEDFKPNCTTVIDIYTIVMDGVTKDENNKIKLIEDGRIYDTESKKLVGTFKIKDNPRDGIQFLIRLPFDKYDDLMSIIYQSIELIAIKMDIPDSNEFEEPTIEETETPAEEVVEVVE